MSDKFGIWFDHGLGDCVQFAHLLQLYSNRNYDVSVHYEKNKEAVWKASGLSYGALECGFPYHAWEYLDGFNLPTAEIDGSGNKAYLNLNVSPLQNIGNRDDLWEELCNTRISGEKIETDECHEEVRKLIYRFPRPIVLLHTHGTNMQTAKNLPDGTVRLLYDLLIENFSGTVVLLDWNFRVPALHSNRIFHIKKEWDHIDCYKLHALMSQSDVLVGVDSGPYHFGMFSDIPTIGVFTGHYPSCVSLPRDSVFNLTRNADSYKGVNIFRRKRWNIGEYSGDTPSAEDLAIHILRCANGIRYLRSRRRIGRDLQLQQMIRDWLGVHGRGLTFDTLLCESTKRFSNPNILETGCIRSNEDWSAGYSTYLFGAYLDGLECGKITSVDNCKVNCLTAKNLTRYWQSRVEIVHSDSVSYLRDYKFPIDVLYLDSMDADVSGHAEHGLAEIQAAYPLLHADSLVMYDDTMYKDAWTGKGALGVPFLLSKGWKCIEDRRQVLLYKGCIVKKNTGVF